MTKSFLKQQRKKLDGMLNACLKEQQRISKGLTVIRGDGQRDTADIANALLNQEVALRRANGCANEIFKVSQAIINIRKNTYGICDSCEEPITVKRLKAIPFADKCIVCQKAEEYR